MKGGILTMGSAFVILGSCFVLGSAGLGLSTALEWFNDIEIRVPKKNKGKSKEVSENDNINNLRKKLKSES